MPPCRCSSATIWGFLTSGGHSKATGLPGLGRTLIMLGYGILSTGLVMWGSVSGSPLITENIGGSSAAFGRAYLGDALLLGFVAAWLPRLLPQLDTSAPVPASGPGGRPTQGGQL